MYYPIFALRLKFSTDLKLQATKKKKKLRAYMCEKDDINHFPFLLWEVYKDSTQQST